MSELLPDDDDLTAASHVRYNIAFASAGQFFGRACQMPHNNSAYQVCGNFANSDQGWCLNCGHEESCHDNP